MIVLDRARLFLGQFVGLATSASYVWAPTGLVPRRVGDLAVVTARFVRGPTVESTRTRTVDEPTEIVWTLASVLADERVGLEVQGALFYADAPAVPVISDVRDAVLADLQLRPAVLPGVTAVSTGVDSITLTGAAGTLYTSDAWGSGASISVSTSIISSSETGNARFLLELQAYAPGSGVPAQSIIGQLAGAVKRYDVIEAGFRLGTGFEGPMGEPVDLTALAGADWESRCMARVSLVLRSYQSTPVEPVERVSFTPTLDGEVQSPIIGVPTP